MLPIFSNITKFPRTFHSIVNRVLPRTSFRASYHRKKLSEELNFGTGACLPLSSTTMRDEQTSTAMTAREREKGATHGIGVVRQGGWLHARRSGRWVERGNGRPERERERETWKV